MNDQERLHELLDVYAKKVDELDAATTELVADQAKTNSWEVSCQVGCDHCCYLYFTATLPEGLLAARAGATDVHHVTAEAKKMLDAGPSRWFAAHRPCLFLKAGLCEIYDRRPVACRAHWAVSKSDDCSRDAAELVDMHGPLHAYDVLAGLFIGTYLLQPVQQARRYVLPEAVRIGMEILASDRPMLAVARTVDYSIPIIGTL